VMFTGGENEIGFSTVNLITGWFGELRRLTGSDDN